MPIINNYDPVTGSGGTVTGGSFNNAPYPECFVRFVPIPSDEKFLLIPAKQESREIDVTFNQPTELYFGSEELPFKILPIGEKFKDTQLGVDLWVKTTEPDCQCLLIIRSEKPIDYIGVTPTPTPTPTPAPSIFIIDADKIWVFPNLGAISNPNLEIELKIAFAEVGTIPNPNRWTFLTFIYIDSYDFEQVLNILGFLYDPYPTIESPTTYNILPSDCQKFKIELRYQGDEGQVEIQPLKVLNIDVNNNILLGI